MSKPNQRTALGEGVLAAGGQRDLRRPRLEVAASQVVQSHDVSMIAPTSSGACGSAQIYYHPYYTVNWEIFGRIQMHSPSKNAKFLETLRC